MKYFILWILIGSHRHEPVGTYESLKQCSQAAAEVQKKIETDTSLDSTVRNMMRAVCLPEGTYPKAPEVRR